ncbi:MAG TPA: carbamoyl-phosphate synthase large subunit, partial [Phycisphaerae bacterium]|nr:carbamoyl-phosphate synthase large subunit [Phycisphaerae bacterium]
LDASMINEIQIDQSLLGWKEYELEVMRDKADNVVIVCSIENFDPMGVHTGDSITVAPAQTLTDKEYQAMRDAAIAIIRAIGVETGGSNIQFAVNPTNGEMVVIEMNPRVSRSSALASKATGFPIARIAAKLAVGYTLDELPNDITRRTVACFEPSIDYVVVKIPRWTFEKFPDADETLTTQMKSVGEAMSIGRTFKEALQKGIRSMEVKRFGLGLDRNDQWWKRQIAEIDDAGKPKSELVLGDRGSFVTRTAALEQAAHMWPIQEDELTRKLTIPSQGRLYYIRYAFKMGHSVAKVSELTKIDPWFLSQMKELTDFEHDLLDARADAADFMAGKITNEQRRKFAQLLRVAKEYGYSDVQLGTVWSLTPMQVRAMRKRLGVEPVYKLVDTCAAEFEAATPYYYSTYEKPISRWLDGQSRQSVDDEVRVTEKKKIIILGGGPNRIGQGIEFDYCCVQAAFACRELGLESVMINSNPETVSTDYDTSNLLFFEPLTLEDVLNIVERLNGKPLNQPGGAVQGVIVQFGGQTPLNLARSLKDSGVPIIGTAVESIEAAEDRDKFNRLIRTLNLRQPEGGIARSEEEARKVAAAIGYPVLMRPSFVLGGRAMEIVSNEEQLNYYIQNAVEVADEHPILIDRFLGDATEVDVDALGDGSDYLILGVMEHIEEAGIHSGDSACSLPPFSLSKKIIDEIKKQTLELAKALEVCGLMNVQFAIKDDQVYVLEVNPRASRTVPFVSKATGIAWAKIAAKVMCGKTLKELGVKTEVVPNKHVAVKESVFPFNKFPGVDIILGPEMRSTGEVMGIDKEFPMAYAKSQMAAGDSLPTSGTVYISVRDSDKTMIIEPARKLERAGFDLICTSETYEILQKAEVKCRRINKIQEGRPNIIDVMKNREVQLLINTPTKKGPNTDEGRIRAAAVLHKLPIITTITGAEAAADAILSLKKGAWTVKPIQEYYAEMSKA